MIKMEQPRDFKGKFILKGEEERKVRTVRLTDTTWNRLGKIAEQQGTTRTNVIEELLNQDDHKNLDEVVKILKEIMTSRVKHVGAFKNQIKPILSYLTKIQEFKKF